MLFIQNKKVFLNALSSILATGFTCLEDNKG